MLTYLVWFDIISKSRETSDRKSNICGSVGTGRRARLRILWLLQSCGFKSHLPHWTIRQGSSKTFGPCLVVQSRSEPWTHGSRSRLRLGRLVAWGPPDLTRPIFRMASVVAWQAPHGSKVSAPLRSLQNRRPPDVLQPIFRMASVVVGRVLHG